MSNHVIIISIVQFDDDIDFDFFLCRWVQPWMELAPDSCPPFACTASQGKMGDLSAAVVERLGMVQRLFLGDATTMTSLPQRPAVQRKLG